MILRLRETRPSARGSQDAGITQPRDYFLADPCISTADYLMHACRSDQSLGPYMLRGQIRVVALLEPRHPDAVRDIIVRGEALVVELLEQGKEGIL